MGRGRVAVRAAVVGAVILGACVGTGAQPRRNFSHGNGLFYDSELNPSLGVVDLINEVDDGDGQRPIHINVFSHAPGIAGRDFALGQVVDDDSAYETFISADLTPAQLPAEISQRAAAGYRPISISGTQDFGGDSRLSVVWLRDDAPFQTRVIIDQDSSGYQTAFDFWANAGYRSLSVSGYSTLNGLSPRFSAIMVNDGLNGWTTSHAIHENNYQTYISDWWDQGYRPISLSAYPWGSQTFFTAVLVRDTSGSSWAARHGLTEAGLDAENANWTNANANIYNKEFRPVAVAAYRSGGITGPKRYAAVWNSSQPRQFHASGNALPGLGAFDDAIEDWMVANDINASSLCISVGGEIKLWKGYTWGPQAFERTQQDDHLRIASSSKSLTATAVVKMIEEGNYIYGMKDGTLQALTLDSPYFMLNGMPDPDPAYGPDIWRTTIRDLLRHRGGWCSFTSHCGATSYFALADDINIMAALGGPLPMSRDDVIQYMLDAQYWGSNNPLDVGYNAGPDQTFLYSNFGYSLLAHLIEETTNTPYEQYVQQQILTPVGATSTYIGRTARLLTDGEVTYSAEQGYVSDANTPGGDPIVDSAVGTSEPGPERVPQPYGRFNIDTIDSTGGWVATSRDMVCFLNSFDDFELGVFGTDADLLDYDAMMEMWGQPLDTGAVNIGGDYALGWIALDVPDGGIAAGSTERMYYHTGALRGTTSYISHRMDGVNVALIASRNRLGNFTGGVRGNINNLINTLSIPPGSVTEPCVPEPCYCEWDGSRGVNVFDLLAYLNDWFAGQRSADVDGNRIVNVFDLLAYLDCWFSASARGGC